MDGWDGSSSSGRSVGRSHYQSCLTSHLRELGQDRRGGRQAKQPAVKEELVASRSLARCGPAAAAAAKIRYQMGEREGQTDLNGAIRHLLACDADKRRDRSA